MELQQDLLLRNLKKSIDNSSSLLELGKLINEMLDPDFEQSILKALKADVHAHLKARLNTRQAKKSFVLSHFGLEVLPVQLFVEVFRWVGLFRDIVRLMTISKTVYKTLTRHQCVHQAQLITNVIDGYPLLVDSYLAIPPTHIVLVLNRLHNVPFLTVKLSRLEWLNYEQTLEFLDKHTHCIDMSGCIDDEIDGVTLLTFKSERVKRLVIDHYLLQFLRPDNFPKVIEIVLMTDGTIPDAWKSERDMCKFSGMIFQGDFHQLSFVDWKHLCSLKSLDILNRIPLDASSVQLPPVTKLTMDFTAEMSRLPDLSRVGKTCKSLGRLILNFGCGLDTVANFLCEVLSYFHVIEELEMVWGIQKNFSESHWESVLRSMKLNPRTCSRLKMVKLRIECENRGSIESVMEIARRGHSFFTNLGVFPETVVFDCSKSTCPFRAYLDHW